MTMSEPIERRIPGVGIQMAQPSVLGVLAFRRLEPSIRSAEDATAAADFEKAKELSRNWFRPTFTRDATAAERHLLDALGYTVPDVLKARVTYVSAGVRHRAFPALGI